MPALIEKISSSAFAGGLARFIVPHHHNNHHPYLLRHESLFFFTFLILLLQFFSFSGISAARVLGYATNIDRSTIIQLTNQERTSRGLAALKENSLLNSAAVQKAEHMFAQDYWDHFAPDGTSPWYFFKKVGYKYSWAGENLARDFQTSAGVIAGWMNSKAGHKENLLNTNFNDIGIGVVDGTLGGEQTTLVVQHLGKSLGIATSNGTGTSKAAASGEPVTVEDEIKTEEKKANTATASASVAQIQEKIGKEANPAFNIAGLWENLGFGQKTTLLLVGILVSLFIFDSAIILKKGLHRQNSHSLLHAGVLLILMIAVAKSAAGGVL